MRSQAIFATSHILRKSFHPIIVPTFIFVVCSIEVEIGVEYISLRQSRRWQRLRLDVPVADLDDLSRAEIY